MRNIVNGLLLRGATILLARRSPHRRTYGGLWSFPGGHVETNETLPQALIRELREEIAVTATTYELLDRFADPNAGPDDPITYHLFTVTAWHGTPGLVGDEHTELVWSTLEQAAGLPDLALDHYRQLFRQLGERSATA